MTRDKRVGGMARSCYGKKRYEHEKWAKKVVNDRLKASGVELRVYLCNNCGGFHLTKLKRGKR